jgi:hypothetical protein
VRLRGIGKVPQVTVSDYGSFVPRYLQMGAVEKPQVTRKVRYNGVNH